MKALRWLLLLLVALLPSGALAWDESGIPSIPHAFYGSVTVNGVPAVAGTVVEATGEGVRTGVVWNPLVTTEAGVYGYYDSMLPKVIVQGDIPPNTSLTFLVNGVVAGQTAIWLEGETTRLDLTAVTFLPNADGTMTYVGQPEVASVAFAGISFASVYTLTPLAPRLWTQVVADTVLNKGDILAYAR